MLSSPRCVLPARVATLLPFAHCSSCPLATPHAQFERAERERINAAIQAKALKDAENPPASETYRRGKGKKPEVRAYVPIAASKQEAEDMARMKKKVNRGIKKAATADRRKESVAQLEAERRQNDKKKMARPASQPSPHTNLAILGNHR